MELDLNALRGEIDGIDARLVELLKARMDTAAKVAAYKKERGLPVLDPARERALLDKVAARAGETFAPYIRAVYGGILAATRDYETALMELGEKNLLLIGMPGSGKSTIGAALARKLGRPLVDLDEEIVKADGRPIPEIFSADGEEFFRQLEHRVLCQWARESGLVISAGGGIVTRPENMEPLHWNSHVIFLLRDLDKLPVDGRPVSQANKLSDLFERRYPLYVQAADLTADNNGTVEETVAQILEKLELA